MSDYICLDTSVLIKVLVEEEDSQKATSLMQKVIQDRQFIVLPSFAWAEVGSILRKKLRKNKMAIQEIVVLLNALSIDNVKTYS